jgi:hypothetical protein
VIDSTVRVRERITEWDGGRLGKEHLDNGGQNMRNPQRTLVLVAPMEFGVGA